MIAETFPIGSLACNCTVLADERTREAVVIDGGDGVPDVLEFLRRRNLRAQLLIHTHGHIDHIGDVGLLRAQTGARALLHPADVPLYHTLASQAQHIGGVDHVPAVVALDGELHDGEHLLLGEIDLAVIHTPGHTLGSVCFALKENGAARLFTGDTLFAGSIGRWDLGGTSMEDIVHSIRTKLLPFADDTPVVPGHGPMTTIGIERKTNPYLHGHE